MDLGKVDRNEGNDSTDEDDEDFNSKTDGGKKGTKRKANSVDGDDDNDDRRAERRAANRESAARSRQRRRILIEDLQKTVSNLTKENTELRNCNNELKVKFDVATAENKLLREQELAITGSRAGSGSGGSTVVPSPATSAVSGNNVIVPQNAIPQATSSNGAVGGGLAGGPAGAGLDASALNSLASLTDLGALRQLLSQPSQMNNSLQIQPAGQQATLLQPSSMNSSMLPGQLQQHLAMLLSNLGQGSANPSGTAGVSQNPNQGQYPDGSTKSS